MSLVSNIVNAIPAKVNAQGEVQVNIDLNDKTFSNLLEKQLNVQHQPDSNLMQTFGINTTFGNSSGINIQDLVSSSINKAEDALSKVEAIGEDILGSSEMVAFLTKPFDSKGSLEHNLGLMNFAKKHAAGFYNKCASNVVTNLAEFVEDTLNLS